MYNYKIRPWVEIYPQLQMNPMTQIEPMLQQLGFDVSPDGLERLFNDFNWTYISAQCMVEAEADIQRIFKTLLFDRDKYLRALDYYKATKKETKEREPDLTTQTTGTASGSASVTRNQKETQEETPQGWGSDRTHYVNPYDNPGITLETKDETRAQGTRKIETSYTGLPDTSTTASNAHSEVLETGTETTTTTTIGSDGKTIAEQIASLEESVTVWQMIKQDLATKLFLQIWR